MGGVVDLRPSLNSAADLSSALDCPVWTGEDLARGRKPPRDLDGVWFSVSMDPQGEEDRCARRFVETTKPTVVVADFPHGRDPGAWQAFVVQAGFTEETALYVSSEFGDVRETFSVHIVSHAYKPIRFGLQSLVRLVFLKFRTLAKKNLYHVMSHIR